VVQLPELTALRAKSSDLAPARVARRMVIYCRISDDREGRQNGVDRQEKQCRALAQRNGDEVVRVFVDDDRSAYSGKPRPDYQRMLTYLRAGNADGVYALAPTRLYRRLNDGLEFFHLINTGRLEVQTVKQGRYDLSTADGRRDALRAAVDAQYESDLISERVRDAAAEKLARGEYRGGPRPFAYESDGVTVRTLMCPRCAGADGFTVDRECRACGAQALNAAGSEAFHLEAAINAVVSGESLRSVCRTLAEAGMRTVARRYRQEDGSKGEPESKEWRAQELRRLLLRPRNAGLIEHEGEVVGRAAWPPIVDETTWRACVAVLTDPSRRTSPEPGRVWLGSGIYKCWCGSTLSCGTAGMKRERSKTGKASRPIYKCKVNANHVGRSAPALDKHVESRVIERLSRADAVDLLLPPRRREDSMADLAAHANALRTKLDSIADDYGADRITRAQMLKMTADTRTRLETVTARMADHASGAVLASLPLGTPQIAEQWPGYHLDKQRAILDALMTVTVHKARKGRPLGFKAGSTEGYFDSSTIELDWKSPE
jgi:site-specific DNA recombinase